MSSFHFHQELPSWAQALLNWALLASFIVQLSSIVLNCTQLCSIVLNCAQLYSTVLNCTQLRPIVLICAQLCSYVHNCAQLCSTVLKCAQLGLILLNLASLRIWWTTKVFSWSASLCERLKIYIFCDYGCLRGPKWSRGPKGSYKCKVPLEVLRCEW